MFLQLYHASKYWLSALFVFIPMSQVAENSPVGTIVGNLTVTDPDNMGNHAGSQTFNCSVVDAYAHSFMVRYLFIYVIL